MLISIAWILQKRLLVESQILSIQKETIKNDHYDYLEIIYIYRLDTFFMVRHYSAVFRRVCFHIIMGQA